MTEKQQIATKVANSETLPEMVTRKDLATYLRVTERTLRNYQVRGLLHVISVGGKRFYLKDDVKKLLTK